MRTKGKNLEWYTLNWSFNDKKLYKFNIFTNMDKFIEFLKRKMTKKEIQTKQDLKRMILLYCRDFWCRREYEIEVNDLCGKPEDSVKIDVFYQVEMNIDRITDYVNTELQIGLE